jgi:uncharacterized protein (DUF1810 family)
MSDLQRFVEAQELVYEDVIAELSAARKRSHWMWFIFPQVAGLGFSVMSRHYALSGLDEARAYLAHPVLGARLRECCSLVLAAHGSANDIFGSPDDMKLHSSLTLFAQAALAETAGERLFADCLDRFFDGRMDQATLDRL